MERDVLLGGLEQLGNFKLAQPDAVGLHLQIEALVRLLALLIVSRRP